MQVNSPNLLQLPHVWQLFEGKDGDFSKMRFWYVRNRFGVDHVKLRLKSRSEKIISDQTLVRILVVDDFVPWRQFQVPRTEPLSSYRHRVGWIRGSPESGRAATGYSIDGRRPSQTEWDRSRPTNPEVYAKLQNLATIRIPMWHLHSLLALKAM